MKAPVKQSTKVVAREARIRAAESILYLTETDQTDPAGRYRFRVDGDKLILERALTAAWATDTDIMTFRNTSTNWVDIDVDFANIAAPVSGLIVEVTGERTGSATAGGVRSLVSSALVGGGNNQNWTGSAGLVPYWASISGGTGTPSGTITNAALFWGEYNGGIDVTITNAYGLYVDMNAGGLGAITTLYGVYINPDGTSLTTTNAYGLYVEEPTVGGTLNRTLFVAGGTSELNGPLDLDSYIDIDITTIGELATLDLAFTRGAGVGAVDQDDFTITRTITGNNNDLSGAVLRLVNSSTTSGTDSTVLLKCGDDGQVVLGADNDGVLVNISAGLAADTASTGLLIGTPISPASAANSLYIANATSNGDWLAAINNGGTSEVFLHMDADVGILYLTPTVGGLTIGLAADAPAPDQADSVLIWVSDSGATAAVANTVLTLEKSDTAYVSFLSPTSGGLIFGDVADDDAGRLIYTHADNSFKFWAGGSQIVDIVNNGTKTTITGLSGDYFQIGTVGTNTSHSLNSENDLFVVGEVEVDGRLFADEVISVKNEWIYFRADDRGIRYGDNYDVTTIYETADANALTFINWMDMSADANNVPVFVWGDQTINNLDLGLFDSVTQPMFASIEKDAKYTSSSSMTAAGAGATMTETGKFASSVVGDVVRVTGGTNATAGWYWITTVTDNDNVDVDRNWCTGAVTDGVMLAYHDFTMLSADGVCTRITDGAPDDNSVEIDRDGWLILDVGQANGRLYWRANNAWHHVNATAGFEIPAGETSCPKCRKPIELGQPVMGITDNKLSDGAIHGVWGHFECLKQ